MSRSITVEILGDSRSLEKAFQKSARDANKFGRGVEKTGKRSSGMFGAMTKSIGGVAGALGAGAAVVGLAGAAKVAFGEMAEGERVAAQTTAVLKSTGGAANVTAAQVDRLAESLLAKSGVDDEAIKSGENLLLTFTNVRNEVGKGNDIFNQATATMLDMSVALGQDTKQSAIQLGKALNDPIKGIGALRRVGVSFTADQIKMVKQLVATGHTLEAQKLILAELNKEFGGSAKAAGETLTGKLNILRETAVNLGGEMATVLTPSIVAAADKMTKWLTNTKNQQTVLHDTQVLAHSAAEGIKAMVEIMKVAITVGQKFASAVSTMNSAFDKLNVGFLHKGILQWDRSGGLLSKLGVISSGKKAPPGPSGPAGGRQTQSVQHIHVNIDGREVGRAVTTHQARTAHRTARQTSGLRTG